MRKSLSICFVVACFVVCVIPFACMTFARTDAAIENKTVSELPSFFEDGQINEYFLSELGAYFEEHFAFRSYFVAMDAKIRSLFGVSAVDTVIKGTDGWLYYKDTLADYERSETLSERQLFNIARNISVMQRFVESKGASFVFTVAPNKNTLYGENMPYYYIQPDKPGNMELLTPYLHQQGVNYADLFSAFENEEEVLYLKRDSHWNNKGALLAYNAVLSAVGKQHDDYSDVSFTCEENEIGDLGRMLYAQLAKPEYNYHYDIGQSYRYTTQTKSVEDPLIVTENDRANGNLLMFRDSFGNTLLPLMANNFANACFSKGMPYLLERFMTTYAPDTVIVEIVERNMPDLASTVPIMTGIAVDLGVDVCQHETAAATVSLEKSMNDMAFVRISGTVTGEGDYTDVYVEADGICFEAFSVSDAYGDFGYCLYLPIEYFVSDSTQINVLIKSDGKLFKVAGATMETGGIFNV